MAEVKPEIEAAAKIKVFGVGGGGGSALERMIAERLRGVEFVAVNTDIQALQANPAKVKIAIGKTVTRGLGAGMNPDLGKRSVEENASDIREALTGADMVFLTAGLGGGTGSGAVPEIAKIAKEVGALTVAVVTKPFTFEGAQRKRVADDAHAELAEHVDTIITIPNDRVLQIIDKKTPLLEAFNIVDDVLRQGVQGIADIITLKGMINVDFADVKAIMHESGSALMGIGSASGDNRAVEAAKMAISSPLLELSIDGAKGILFTVSGGDDLSMHEVAEAAKVITGSADDDAKVIFGAHVDEDLGEEIRITVVATGFDNRERRSAPTLAGDVEVNPQTSWNPARQASESTVGRFEVNDSPFGKRKTPSFEETQRESEESSAAEAAPVERVSEQDGGQEMSAAVKEKLAERPDAKKEEKKDDEGKDDDDLGIPAFIRRKMM